MSADPNVTQEPIYETNVEQGREFVRSFLSNLFPNLDLQPARVLHDLLIEPSSIITAYNQANLDRYRRASSLTEIEEDPTLADDDDVDRILGNFLVTRREGARASGQVTIVLSSEATVNVPTGATFTSDGLVFTSTASFISNSRGDTTNSRPLTELADGTWAFTIDVEAAESGSAYTLRKGTQLEWTDPPTMYVTSYAEEDFEDGEDEETNSEMLDRLNLGITAKVMGGRQNVESLVKEVFPAVSDISIIGGGDTEMLRDSHNIFGIKTGNKADIYVRTSGESVLRTFTMDCQVVSVADKTLQLSIGRDIYPGFYMVNSIYPTDVNALGSSLEILAELRGVDTTNLSYDTPYIYNTTEGAYTRFQTSALQFKDPTLDATDVLVGDTIEYKVDIIGMPQVGAIQDYISNRRVRTIMGDYLVKATLPFFVALSIDIDWVVGDRSVDTTAVKLAAMNFINGTKFSDGKLPASKLYDAIQDVLDDRAAVRSPTLMTAALRLPDGTLYRRQESHELVAPTNTTLGVSPRNVSFITGLPLISVSVNQVDSLSI